MGAPSTQFNRAYAILEAKAVKEGERRVIRGLATSPAPDRVGDIIEPRGAKFAESLPLLLHHDSKLPVGFVKLHKATDEGITFEAHIPEILEPASLRDRVEEAWGSIKSGLIRGVSIGFRALEDGVEVMKSGGLRFKSIEILELSLVAVPAHQDAGIHSIKSLDAQHLAESGETDTKQKTAAAVATPRVVKATPQKAPAMTKTIQEQKQSFEATRQAKSARMTDIMQKAADEGVTLDKEQTEEYDNLTEEVKAIDAHLVRLDALEKANIAKAAPVSGVSPAAASASREPSIVSVKSALPEGIGFARYAKALLVAYRQHRNIEDVAKAMYPGDDRLLTHVKAAVPAATTTEATWASPLVDPTNLVGEFIEFLRPKTIIGKFGTNGIPSLRRIPFNVRIIEQTVGGTGYWVGQGAPKPLTSFGYAPVTNAITKVAAITVLTDELIRLATPSADMLARDGLTSALVERIDRDLIDPAEAGTANVQPASLTNGLTALTSAGTSADNARTDLTSLLTEFINANIDPTSLVVIMPNTLALALSLMRNSLGQKEFPDLTMNGGFLEGIPVITSQYAANASGGGNLVIAVNASDVFLSDDGAVTIDASREASLQMLDNPTNNSATATPTTMVSMWQTNSVALRAERFINWSKRRDDAVVYMDDVNWGSVGSPA